MIPFMKPRGAALLGALENHHIRFYEKNERYPILSSTRRNFLHDKEFNALLIESQATSADVSRGVY